MGKTFEAIHKKNLNIGDAARTNEINIKVKSDFQIQTITPIVTFTDNLRSDQDISPSSICNIKIFTSPAKIKSTVKNCKPKKSWGFDKIYMFILKKLPPVFYIVMSVLINNCLNIGYFPNSWKCAKIIPILKHGKNPNYSGSYRPISLLSYISKIFEYVLNQLILEIVNTCNIIPDFQHGFRKHHSTIHTLSKLSNDITNALNQN